MSNRTDKIVGIMVSVLSHAYMMRNGDKNESYNVHLSGYQNDVKELYDLIGDESISYQGYTYYISNVKECEPGVEYIEELCLIREAIVGFND
jgi:hypothetical protein